MLAFDHIHNLEKCKMEKYNKVTKLNNFKPKVKNLTEKELRVQLAAAYRIFNHLKWDYLIYGHITVRVPGPEKHFLINPFGLRYDEVTASNLVKIDLDGNIVEKSEHPVNPAGFIIHSAIHSTREDAHCVMHTHTPAGMAAAALKEPIKNIPKEALNAILYGLNDVLIINNKTLGVNRKYEITFEGIVNFIEEQYKNSESIALRRWEINIWIE